MRRGKKEYKQEGLLKEVSGLKISSNAVLVPSHEALNIKKLFKEFKISYKIIESWIRR